MTLVPVSKLLETNQTTLAETIYSKIYFKFVRPGGQNSKLMEKRSA